MKILNYSTIEVDGVNSWDYPDFSDAYVSYAEYTDGTPLDDNELDDLGDLAQELAINKYI